MNLFQRFFGRKDEDPSAVPWGDRPSILGFVLAQIPPDGPGMTTAGYTLPDQEQINQGSKVRWAAGAMDGVMTHHVGNEDHHEAVRKVVALILAYARQPSTKHQAAVYQHLLAEPIVSIIDPVIETLVKESELNHERLYDLAHWLVTSAPDREPVKFGLAILGLFQNPANEELFQALGRHDEFTLFCAVALANGATDKQAALWKLARNVTGWGRIHTVERLAQGETNPEIQDWLLREGFRNDVMYEYLAGTCAKAGGLLAALSADHVNHELLTGAGEILQALIAGGPAGSIDDYDDARLVVEHFLRHQAMAAETVGDFLHVSAIKEYLSQEDSYWGESGNTDWTAEVRDRLRRQCASILERPEWPGRVRAQLRSADDIVFSLAAQAAKALGIDTWDIHWQRLEEQPKDQGRWFRVMELCGGDEIDAVIEFAEARLDLVRIASGAADESGFDKEFEEHRCLEILLQELRHFPHKGDKLIAAGLKSPIVRSRNMAVYALAAWPRPECPSELQASLERAIECEPNDSIRNNMQKVLCGEPLES